MKAKSNSKNKSREKREKKCNQSTKKRSEYIDNLYSKLSSAQQKAVNLHVYTIYIRIYCYIVRKIERNIRRERETDSKTRESKHTIIDFIQNKCEYSIGNTGAISFVSCFIILLVFLSLSLYSFSKIIHF